MPTDITVNGIHFEVTRMAVHGDPWITIYMGDIEGRCWAGAGYSTNAAITNFLRLHFTGRHGCLAEESNYLAASIGMFGVTNAYQFTMGPTHSCYNALLEFLRHDSPLPARQEWYRNGRGDAVARRPRYANVRSLSGRMSGRTPNFVIPPQPPRVRLDEIDLSDL